MRLDKFLKTSRVIKRRTVANDACDAGRVTLNGKVAKAASEVNEGDVIEIRFGAETTRLQVRSVRENANKDEAAEMVSRV